MKVIELFEILPSNALVQIGLPTEYGYTYTTPSYVNNTQAFEIVMNCEVEGLYYESAAIGFSSYVIELSDTKRAING